MSTKGGANMMSVAEKFMNNLLVLLDHAKEVNESCRNMGVSCIDSGDIDSLEGLIQLLDEESALKKFIKEILPPTVASSKQNRIADVQIIWAPMLQKDLAGLLDGCRKVKNNQYGQYIERIAGILDTKKLDGTYVVGDAERDEFWRELQSLLKCSVRYMLLERSFAENHVGLDERSLISMASALKLPIQAC